MKVKCPTCWFAFDIWEAIREEALLEAVKMQSTFGQHSRLVLEYTELFNAVRPIKALKLHRILSEVKSLWVSGKFSLQKRTYRISQAGIVEALKIMCNKHFESPLQNHNYLKKIMIGIAEKEENERSIRVERELREKEDRLRKGLRLGETSRVKREMPESVKEIIGKL
ncbi:MAG: hypothetical protein ACE5IH_08040 [Thermodesulfobacteriota bacterium]